MPLLSLWACPACQSICAFLHIIDPKHHSRVPVHFVLCHGTSTLSGFPELIFCKLHVLWPETLSEVVGPFPRRDLSTVGSPLPLAEGRDAAVAG